MSAKQKRSNSEASVAVTAPAASPRFPTTRFSIVLSDARCIKLHSMSTAKQHQHVQQMSMFRQRLHEGQSHQNVLLHSRSDRRNCVCGVTQRQPRRASNLQVHLHAPGRTPRPFRPHKQVLLVMYD